MARRALMRKNRFARWVAGLASAAASSIGVAAPAGLAQTCADINGPIYCPPEGPGATTATPTKAQLRKKCIAKAQTKFGDNRPKKKAAIRKCKKKYR